MANENIDHNDPLFLHSRDHPGLSLVPQVFDGTNFGEWKISLYTTLSTKNKASFVNGALAKPPKTGPRFERWERCNSMVTMWILNALSPDIRCSVLYADTTRGIWEDLVSRYGQVNGTQLYSLEKELSALNQGSSSIAAYFTRFKALWDELSAMRQYPPCTCGCVQAIVRHDEERKLIHFLMGLNEQYTTVRGGILMIKPLPTLSIAYPMLLQEEK